VSAPARLIRPIASVVPLSANHRLRPGPAAIPIEALPGFTPVLVHAKAATA
jgi:hypothetical protein